MTGITDEQIIKIISERNNCMTYVVAYCLRLIDNSIKTPAVLRRLKKMEAAGKIKRVKSIYKVQLCWSLNDVNP